jgi:hypothetical protein
MRIGKIKLNAEVRDVKANGTARSLTRTEFRLLAHMFVGLKRVFFRGGADGEAPRRADAPARDSTRVCLGMPGRLRRRHCTLAHRRRPWRAELSEKADESGRRFRKTGKWECRKREPASRTGRRICCTHSCRAAWRTPNQLRSPRLTISSVPDGITPSSLVRQSQTRRPAG